MPFVKRLVEPVFVCHVHVDCTSTLTSLPTTDTLEEFVNHALASMIRQLANVRHHADSIFRELQRETDGLARRTFVLRHRIDSLTEAADHLTFRMWSFPVYFFYKKLLNHF